MLYLKLAQLRGALQHTRQESIEIHEQFEDESRFRKSVAESACKFKQELDVSRRFMIYVFFFSFKLFYHDSQLNFNTFTQ